MKRWQKVILAFLGVLVILIGGSQLMQSSSWEKQVENSRSNMKKSSRVSTKRDNKVNIDDKEPFSVLLLGLDTGGLGRTEQGRSDTMMVVTWSIHNKKNQRSSV